jgi:hypothetical protein
MGIQQLALTFRHEGIWWDCYVIRPEQADDPTSAEWNKLGSIAMAGVVSSPECERMFMLAMKEAATVFCRETFGGKVVFEEIPLTGLGAAGVKH